jgi:hypothetical protein
MLTYLFLSSKANGCIHIFSKLPTLCVILKGIIAYLTAKHLTRLVKTRLKTVLIVCLYSGYSTFFGIIQIYNGEKDNDSLYKLWFYIQNVDLWLTVEKSGQTTAQDCHRTGGMWVGVSKAWYRRPLCTVQKSMNKNGWKIEAFSWLEFQLFQEQFCWLAPIEKWKETSVDD